MTLLEFTGCALTAYGPALSLFILTVMGDPIRIIILIVSAFFWLLAFLVSSLFWNFIAFRHVLPLCIIVSVIVQEVFRYCFYRLTKKAENGLKKMRMPGTNTDLLNNKHIVPFVSGFGYGVMSAGFSLSNILAELSGPGTVGLLDPQPFFCLRTSLFTMMFTFLHTFWSIIFFSGLDHKKTYLVIWVIGSHLLVSCLSLLNQHYLHLVSLIMTAVVLIVSSYLSLNICRNRDLVTQASN